MFSIWKRCQHQERDLNHGAVVNKKASGLEIHMELCWEVDVIQSLTSCIYVRVAVALSDCTSMSALICKKARIINECHDLINQFSFSVLQEKDMIDFKKERDVKKNEMKMSVVLCSNHDPFITVLNIMKLRKLTQDDMSQS